MGLEQAASFVSLLKAEEEKPGDSCRSLSLCLE